MIPVILDAIPAFNFPPEFDAPLVDQVYQLTPEATSFEYILPSFSDPAGDSVSIIINSMSSFMAFDMSMNTLSFNDAIAGSFVLDIVLTDQFGMQLHSSLKIDVLAEVVTEE